VTSIGVHPAKIDAVCSVHEICDGIGGRVSRPGDRVEIEQIIAKSPLQTIRPAAALERVASIGASHCANAPRRQVYDRSETLCPAIRLEFAPQRVDPVATGDMVRALAVIDDVVADTTLDEVVALSRKDHVFACQPAECLTLGGAKNGIVSTGRRRLIGHPPRLLPCKIPSFRRIDDVPRDMRVAILAWRAGCGSALANDRIITTESQVGG
jgi:hypothetical protein